MYVQWDIQSLSEVDRDTLLPVLVVSGTPIGQAEQVEEEEEKEVDNVVDSWTCPSDIGHWTVGHVQSLTHFTVDILF